MYSLSVSWRRVSISCSRSSGNVAFAVGPSSGIWTRARFHVALKRPSAPGKGTSSFDSALLALGLGVDQVPSSRRRRAPWIGRCSHSGFHAAATLDHLDEPLRIWPFLVFSGAFLLDDRP
jgi:hypothetical protein